MTLRHPAPRVRRRPSTPPLAYGKYAIGLSLALWLGCAAGDSAIGATTAPDVADVSGGPDSAVADVSFSSDPSPTDLGGSAVDASAVEDLGPRSTPDVAEPPVDTAYWEVGADGDAQPVDSSGVSEPSDVQTQDVAEVVEPSTCQTPRPIVLVHGINGSSADYDVMAPRLIEAGWPAEYVVRFDAADPSWGCNVDNAQAIADLVQDVLADTGHERIDLVAHSMGTLSSRYFVKHLGGADVVNTYVTLGGMHHGLFSPCLAPEFLGVCVWQELCQTGAYVADLNAPPATPGSLHWVSMFGTADETVPNESSTLDGAENISFDGVEHAGPNGLLEVPEVFDEILRVLDYPCW